MKKVIALDTETFLITREEPVPKLVCVSTCNSLNKVPSLFTHDSKILAQWLESVLVDEDFYFVGHNIAFDFAVLARQFPTMRPLIFDAYRNGRVTDTMIRQQLYDISAGNNYANDGVRSYTLGELYDGVCGEQLTGKDKSDENSPRMTYGDLYSVPLDQWPQQYIDYSKADAVATLEIYLEQEKQCGEIFVDDWFQSYAAFCLYLVSCQGMLVDATAVAAFRKKLEKEMAELVPSLETAGLITRDKKGRIKKSSKKAKELVLEACKKLNIIPLLTDGAKERGVKPRTIDDVCFNDIAIDKAAVYWCEDPMLKTKIKYTEKEKLLTTYIPFLEKGCEGFPVHTRFNLAASGRVTSGTPSAPLVGGPFQTMPREEGVRECFIPRPGKIFLAADLSGAELHTLAQVCLERLDESSLAVALNSGQDAHLMLAQLLLNCDYDTVKALLKAGDPIATEARQDAKIANFGLGGLMGAWTFMVNRLKKGDKWPIEKAEKICTAWYKRWPEMRKYHDSCKKEVGVLGRATVKSYFSGRVRTVRGVSACANNNFQSLAADGAKLALCEVQRRCLVEKSSALYGCVFINFLHDELLLEVPDDKTKAHRAAQELKMVMEQQFNIVVPACPTTVEPTLMRRWTKKAKPVFDNEGFLIPWEDR